MLKRTFLFTLAAVALALLFLSPSSHAAPGDLYVAEATSGTIFKFTPEGTKTIFASGIHQPVALAFDRQGNLFVANSGAGDPQMPSSILKFTPDGTESTFATNDSSAILGLAFDGVGNLFATTGFILKFAPDGTVTGFAPSVQSAWPLTFDSLGNLYAGNNPAGPRSILKIAPDESISTFTSFPGGGLTTAMAFDGSGNLFARVDGDIFKVDSTGSNTVFASGNFESALAFDASGNLFAVLDAFDSTQPAIVKFAPDGTQTTFAFGVLLPAALAFEPVVEKLRNVSARALVGAGDNVLIGGFIVGGNALANNAVVARAIGPSLAQAGVANPLADPILELHNSAGAIVASNDNWQDTQADQITASGLAPTDPKESAIFATLPAGAYTAVVRGAGDTTGVGLVEVYSISE